MDLIAPVPWTDVKLDGGFLGERQRVNRRVTLPIEYEQCASTGRFDAFKLQWKPGAPNRPHHFWDSDVAKWIEAVGYSLATHPDSELQSRCDAVIDLIASAQQADGYLNCYFTAVEPDKRWTNLRDMHELYCAGHLIEAAVAYFRGTGQRKLLEVMCRYVNHIGDTFGPGDRKMPGYPGHPEIELALMKLHQVTGDPRHLKLAEFFVTERGRPPHYYAVESERRGEKPTDAKQLDYYQADKPIVDQQTLNGHAVRALYLMSGAVDVAAATKNRKLLSACKRLWKNVTQRRMYLTGGVGSARDRERFTFDYDLPNETAYAETCAAIALALFAHRLLQIELSNEYGDVIERTLYNGIASGVSLSGDRFFYANPLAIADEALTTESEVISARRKPWFGCSCCPPNVARLSAWMGQFVYSAGADRLCVHLYAAGEAKAAVTGQEITVRQKTNYPWDGAVSIAITPEKPAKFTVALRIPAWCDGATIAVNGKKIRPAIENGYAHLSRTWQKGDLIKLHLPMPVQVMQTNPRSRNNIGKLAVQRGPIVYCAEQADNPDLLPAAMLNPHAKFIERFEPKLLGGIMTLIAPAVIADDRQWGEKLYARAGKTQLRPAKLKLIPYCVWGNRKVGKMQVWFAQSPAGARR
ncbi:MAG TPA: beta-L-arabinofuranosidase domain-containing protein [Tepidisphaeraceae bacterium]|nr:beta-L-arabinofuranosidase domain-containing protein [Tepidisphaeraceae bacterium]